MLNKFVIYFSLPAMILLQIPKLNISQDSLIPIVVAWSTIILCAILVLIFSKIFNFSKEITGALLLVAPLGNTSFLGIPIVQSYYGDLALPYVIIYDQVGSFLALATYGTFVVAYYSNKTKVNLSIILKKLFTFPPFIFLLLAFALVGIEYEPLVADILKVLSSTIVPFAVLAVGMQLKLMLPKDDLKPFSTALLIKLIISPILAVIVCKLFSFSGDIASISIMEAGMGPMITAGAMASIAGMAPRLVSSILGYGIIVSFMTTYILYVSF